MYKLSVPLAFNTLKEENLDSVLETLRESKVQRVFICCIGSVYEEDSQAFVEFDKLKRLVKFFKDAGLETGIWVNGFGHGSGLAHEEKSLFLKKNYTYITSIEGQGNEFGLCPLDETFRTDYTNGIKRIAHAEPDIIMIDDDYRFNNRGTYMCCFCELHLKEFYKRVGEKIPKEQIEKLVFTGGKNKYRDAYMDMMADSLIGFAKNVREGLDKVNPSIRLGACTVLENWDYCGTDAMEIARAFAGNTQPFIRTIGAPYWSPKIHEVIEDSRLEAFWCKDSGIEVFAEGDVYTRPRYNVPASFLELFDFAMLADDNMSGILKYMFDYSRDYSYETGYVERHIHNESKRNAVKEIFANKKNVGVRAVNELHKVRDWVLPNELVKGIARKMIAAYKSTSEHLLAKNAIPTVFGKSEYPCFVCTENARYVTKEDLENGAVLDISAAKILTELGIDVGLVSIDGDLKADSERFYPDNDCISGVGACRFKKITCKDSVTVKSTFGWTQDIASYTYENADGQRFYVLANDFFESETKPNYFNNYHRQKHLVEALEWCGRKPLPAVSTKNPFLYMMTAKGEDGSMAVMLLNIFEDNILTPLVKLDKEYKNIKFVNCSGNLCGNEVKLSEIAPFGMAAFEVK